MFNVGEIVEVEVRPERNIKINGRYEMRPAVWRKAKVVRITGVKIWVECRTPVGPDILYFSPEKVRKCS